MIRRRADHDTKTAYRKDAARRDRSPREVGTGWDTKALPALRSRLDELEQHDSPFDDEVRERGVVHWVRPEFVAQIGFTEWTRDGMLRHPRYFGVRADKRPRVVVREEPA